MNQIFLLLGSNLGDKKGVLAKTVHVIGFRIGNVFAKSSFYVTEPWGNTNQPSFINQVIGVTSLVGAKDLLYICKKIEKEIGRVNTEKWGPRIIDIDILYYGDQVISMEDLTIPHPQLHLRRFTLEPLNEIAPDYIHPLLKKNTNTLLNECSDSSSVIKLISDDI
jgi:2-amino-4-hydroxy-6-hydroxymethyldihydropteridine diphosphokinase